MTEKIQADPHIEVFTSSVIKNVEGSLGNFHATIQHDDKEILIDVGTVVVAVGGHEFKPEGYYLYKENPNVFTNLEFEALLEAGQLKSGESLAFIQCVGSREPHGRTYCSATCCGSSIKNALKVKEKFPDSNIYIFYRDIRVSYTEELEYRLAREKGINFVQYEASHPPVVKENQKALTLEVEDFFTNDLLTLTFDKIILATPLVTSEQNKELSEMLKVPLDSNGFFLEAHTKLRPVDFATDGVFLCGTAQGPKNVKESISQALGAASRALKLLMNGEAIVEGITASITEEKCIGCGTCVEVCPYNAIGLIEIDKQMGLYKTKVLKARVNVGICKGCGACVAECPVNAINQNNFTSFQINKMIETLIEF
ncbi:MAG: CoB--CoM heterodisulfide reductase iron-sulfur subunit A family protein, partial [Promethearchaeota archaeon]